MTFSWTRVKAISQKELRDFSRNRFVVLSMAVMPVILLLIPTIELFTIPSTLSTHRLDTRIGLSLLYLLIIPAIVPSALAAYAVVGEREQGTLEPVLTTPLRSEEFLVGKGLAALVPTLLIAYTLFGVFLAAAAIFAKPVVASAIFGRSHLLVQILFTPLLAGWSIWVAMAISARSLDVRAAQQLGILASTPPLVIVALMTTNVITPTLGLALGLAAALLIVDALGWRFVAALFDRERLVTGGRQRAAWRASTAHQP
jgi:ABC-2 type transport system permease protein